MGTTTKIQWVKETPTTEGWFWMKYKNKRGKYIICPAEVVHFKDGGTLVKSAENDTFMEGPNHGGPGLKYSGKVDKSVRFGPEIVFPPELED